MLTFRQNPSKMDCNSSTYQFITMTQNIWPKNLTLIAKPMDEINNDRSPLLAHHNFQFPKEIVR